MLCSKVTHLIKNIYRLNMIIEKNLTEHSNIIVDIWEMYKILLYMCIGCNRIDKNIYIIRHAFNTNISR